MQMIDIHSHVLPFVDDGSDELQKSLAMLRKSESAGITDLILTPHYRHKYNESVEKLKSEFESFNRIKNDEGINVNLYLGQEIYYKPQTKKLLQEGRLLSLNDTEYVLIEFRFDEFCDIAEAVYELATAGYVPIVAHAERYRYFSIVNAEEVKSLGGLIQINASSINGFLGHRCKKRTKNLFKNGLVDFVASDAHYNRKNNMTKAYAWVKRKYGQQTAEKVFMLNAEKIIKGRN